MFSSDYETLKEESSDSTESSDKDEKKDTEIKKNF